MPNERMVVQSNPHWLFFWKQVLEGVGILVLAVLALSFDGTVGTVLGWLTVLGLLIWAGHTLYQFVQWRTLRFSVTDRRIAYQSGSLRRTAVSIPLDRVTNVNFEQALVARLFKNGTLTIESAGESGTSVFENIPHPEHVRSVIFAQIEALKVSDAQKNADAVASAMSSTSASSTAGVSERLHELEQLRAQGLVSDEEYTRTKAAILGDL